MKKWIKNHRINSNWGQGAHKTAHLQIYQTKISKHNGYIINPIGQQKVPGQTVFVIINRNRGAIDEVTLISALA